MPNHPKAPQEIATTNTYSARPDYHVFLALLHYEQERKVNISLGIRSMVNRLVKTDPHCARLFQKAGEIQAELEEMEKYLEQKPQERAKLQVKYGKKKNLLLEWRLEKPAEFQALLVEFRSTRA